MKKKSLSARFHVFGLCMYITRLVIMTLRFVSAIESLFCSPGIYTFLRCLVQPYSDGNNRAS